MRASRGAVRLGAAGLAAAILLAAASVLLERPSDPAGASAAGRSGATPRLADDAAIAATTWVAGDSHFIGQPFTLVVTIRYRPAQAEPTFGGVGAQAYAPFEATGRSVRTTRRVARGVWEQRFATELAGLAVAPGASYRIPAPTITYRNPADQSDQALPAGSDVTLHVARYYGPGAAAAPLPPPAGPAQLQSGALVGLAQVVAAILFAASGVVLLLPGGRRQLPGVQQEAEKHGDMAAQIQQLRQAVAAGGDPRQLLLLAASLGVRLAASQGVAATSFWSATRPPWDLIKGTLTPAFQHPAPTATQLLSALTALESGADPRAAGRGPE